jgi:hypothetical protein
LQTTAPDNNRQFSTGNRRFIEGAQELPGRPDDDCRVELGCYPYCTGMDLGRPAFPLSQLSTCRLYIHNNQPIPTNTMHNMASMKFLPDSPAIDILNIR